MFKQKIAGGIYYALFETSSMADTTNDLSENFVTGLDADLIRKDIFEIPDEKCHVYVNCDGPQYSNSRLRVQKWIGNISTQLTLHLRDLIVQSAANILEHELNDPDLVNKSNFEDIWSENASDFDLPADDDRSMFFGLRRFLESDLRSGLNMDGSAFDRFQLGLNGELKGAQAFESSPERKEVAVNPFIAEDQRSFVEYQFDKSIGVSYLKDLIEQNLSSSALSHIVHRFDFKIIQQDDPMPKFQEDKQMMNKLKFYRNLVLTLQNLLNNPDDSLTIIFDDRFDLD
jgi:hypothetical protein